jgi:hypothetical protein
LGRPSNETIVWAKCALRPLPGRGLEAQAVRNTWAARYFVPHICSIDKADGATDNQDYF